MIIDYHQLSFLLYFNAHNFLVTMPWKHLPYIFYQIFFLWFMAQVTMLTQTSIFWMYNDSFHWFCWLGESISLATNLNQLSSKHATGSTAEGNNQPTRTIKLFITCLYSQFCGRNINKYKLFFIPTNVDQIVDRKAKYHFVLVDIPQTTCHQKRTINNYWPIN